MRLTIAKLFVSPVPKGEEGTALEFFRGNKEDFEIAVDEVLEDSSDLETRHGTVEGGSWATRVWKKVHLVLDEGQERGHDDGDLAWFEETCWELVADRLSCSCWED